MPSIYESGTSVPRTRWAQSSDPESTLNLVPVNVASKDLAESYVYAFRPQGHKSYQWSSRSPLGWRSSLGNTEFSPNVDVFDAPASYAIHVSLPGAREEDIGVNYDEQESEIQISGVILRGGGRDEVFLKALTLGEMDAGLFEKKVKLGNQSHPAVVDTDGITALLENGVLEIFVPKREVEVIGGPSRLRREFF